MDGFEEVVGEAAKGFISDGGYMFAKIVVKCSFVDVFLGDDVCLTC